LPPFESLQNHQGGKIWKRLLAARQEQTNWFFEGEPPNVTELVSGPGVLYHYTSVTGLQGILQSNRLWATAAYFLNDSSEVEYGCQLVRQALLEWHEANEGNDGFAAETLRFLEQVFSSPLSQISRLSTIYVTCFCQNGNLLSQWRAYGQIGGYSLGFHIARGNLGLKIQGGFWDLRLAKVIYNDFVQKERINSFLKEAFIAISEPSLAEVSDAERKVLQRDALMYIENQLVDEIVTFKNPAFKEEREWRLIVRPRLLDSEEPGTSVGERETFKFRGWRGFLIPYLELRPINEHLPLKSVRFGPSLDPIRAGNSVRMLLVTCGFREVKVSGSEIPVIL
jgi:hypothetical protein